MLDFYVKDGKLYMEMKAPHTQVLPYYNHYDINSPTELADNNYRNMNNSVGHAQRSLLVYYGLKGFLEHGGVPGVDLGSAGVVSPGCVSLDIYGNGDTPTYGGTMTGVQIKADASNLFMFQDNSLSSVINSHLVEHIPCANLPTGTDQRKRIDFNCPGYEVIRVFRNHWIRVLRPGGYLVCIIPDNGAARNAGSSVFLQDTSHQHAWSAEEFHDVVVSQLLDLIEVVSFDTLKNNFSFELIGKKR